ncbi:MAG: Sporulation kinase E [Betaproteobacteria bacterium ADurb.Bin341]|nr:MAG: Sporulation kinase E [Betaproteobacteria bacterium ADurb.Bin341]
MSLLNRLVFFLVLPFLLGTALLLLVTGRSLETKLRADLSNKAQATINLQVRAIQTLIERYQQAIQALSKEAPITSGNASLILPQIAAAQRRMPDVDTLLFVDFNQRALASNGTVFELDIREHIDRLRSGKPAVTLPFICRFTQRPVVLLLEPVIGPGGEAIGAVGATVNLRSIESFFASIRGDGKPLNLLTDPAGRIIMGIPGEPSAFNQFPDDKKTPVTARLVAALQEESSLPVTVRGVEKEAMQVFHARIPITGWNLVLAYPEKETYASVHHIWRQGFWLLLALALVSMAGVLIFRHALLRPIQRLSEAQKKLEEGQLGVRIPEPKIAELGQLAHSFNGMADRLQDALHSAQAAEQKFRAIFESAKDAICLFDGNHFIDLNPAAERMAKYSRDELLKIGPIDISPEFQPDGRLSLEAGQEYLERALAGETQIFKWRHTARDGSPIDIESCLNRIEINDKIYVLSIARDLMQTLQVEAVVHDTEEKFRRVFEASPDSIVIAQLNDGKIIDCNEGFNRIAGYCREEAIGRTFLELGIWVHPEERQRMVERMIGEGLVQNFHAKLQRKDGSTFDAIASTGTFILNGVSHYVAIVRDISAEMATQRALATSEARLKTILDAAPVPIALVRLADFTYLSTNPAHERLFGLSDAELRGKTIREAGIVIVDEHSKIREQTKRLIAQGSLDNEEAEAYDAKGRRITFVYSSRIVEIDGEQVILSISTDISRLKMVEEGLRRTEEALRESEQRFFALFQSSPAALAVFHQGRHGYTVLQLNQVWFSTFLYPEEEVIGKSPSDFGFWQDEAEHQQFLDRLKAQGEVRGFEAWLRRHDGTEILCAISGRTVAVGKHRMLLAAYADITQQREFEAALHDFNVTQELRIQERTRELQQTQANLMHSEKLAALGALVAGVAHELSTPIGNSLVVATTLTDQTNTLKKLFETGMKRSELEKFILDSSSGLAILERNLGRATELIQNFRSVAVDQTSTRRRQFNLAKVVDETLATMHHTLKKTPYVLKVEIDPDLEMDSFPGPLEQIIINLINNSILHGFENRDEGCVSVCAKALAQGWIHLSIADDGCGVSPAGLRRIFDPFFTTKLGKGGSGLGLHIVRNIVEDVLGGQIKAESEPGKGLTLIINLPSNAPELAQEGDE